MDIFAQCRNKTWQGFLNISKCKHLSCTWSPSVGRTYTFKIDLENVIIQQTREDLGT